MPARDADMSIGEQSDVYLPDAIDAEDPLDFLPADPPDANPAYNPNQPREDAEVAPDAGPLPSGCLAPGDEQAIDGALIASRTWRRIEPDGCPATRLTDREVAYAIHWVCAWQDSIMIDVAMLGADQLARPDAIADPVLVAYPDDDALVSDPFACLAVSDDGMFGGGVADSSRIESLVIGAGERVAIVATSYARPDQHGIGTYRLELSAR